MLRLITAVLILAGCAKKPETKPPPETPPGATPSTDRDRVLELKSLQAIAANESSYEASLARATRQEEQLQIPARIPTEPCDTAEFVEALKHSGEEHRVTLHDIVVTPRTTTPPEVPKTVTEAYEWPLDALRTVYDVTFRLEATSAGGFKRWYAALAHDLERLVYIHSAEEIPGGWNLKAEIYGFRKVEVPRHVVADEALKAEVPGVEEALIPLTQAHYLSARFDFFRDRAKAVEGLSADMLLGREPRPPTP